MAPKCWFTEIVGKKYAKTTKSAESIAKPECIMTELDSCNSPITHTSNWCYMKMSFSNCPSMTFTSGKCKTPSTRGKCQKNKINGNVIRVDMHEDHWKGKKSEPVPAGFTIYTDANEKLGYGTEGKTTKTWKGKGRICGASYDVSGESDYFQFKMCNDDSWWKNVKKSQVCQSDNIAAKSILWAADVLGVDCKGV